MCAIVHNVKRLYNSHGIWTLLALRVLAVPGGENMLAEGEGALFGLIGCCMALAIVAILQNLGWIPFLFY